MNAKKLVKESKKRIEKSEWFLSFPKNERIKKKDGQYDYYVTDKNGIRDKLSKKEIFEFRSFELNKKDTLSNKEKKEIEAIEKELTEMSLERKKKKNGKYEYIIQDNIGKLMYKVNVINENFEDGRQIGDGFYEFTIRRKIPNYKLDGYKVIVDNKSNELVKMTNKTIFSNTGDQMLNGIKNVISYNFEKGHFLLELDLAFFLIFEKDFEKRFNLPKKYDLKKQKLRCVIDKDREYIVKPTFDAIPFN